MAKKSKGEKQADKQAKDVKKLRKSVEALAEQNEDLTKSVKKLRKSQEKSREEFGNIVRDLEARIEAPGVEASSSSEASSVTVGADGAIVSGDASGVEESSDSPGAPTISADDGIEGDGEPLEESSDAPTVSADDGISSGSSPTISSPTISAPASSVKATESAKRKADELGVDLSSVTGTGSRNRVTVADVEKAKG